MDLPDQGQEPGAGTAVAPTRFAVTQEDPKYDQAVQFLRSEADRIVNYAKALVVTTTAESATASDELTAVKGVHKRMMEKRREYMVPVEDHRKAVDAVFKPIIDGAVVAEVIIKDKIKNYLEDLERERLLAEETSRKVAEAVEAAAEIKDPVVRDEAFSQLETVETFDVPEEKHMVRGTAGSAGLVANWKARVVDIKKLIAHGNEAYLLPNMSTLNAAAKTVKDTADPPPGVEYFNEPYVSGRR